MNNLPLSRTIEKSSDSRSAPMPPESPESPTSSPETVPQAIKKRGWEYFDEPIGFGSFSTVYKAKMQQLGNRMLACKKIQVDKVSENWRDKCMKNELKIIKVLKHPRIIKVFDVVKTRRACFILMDYAEKGSIYDVLHPEDKQIQYEFKAKKSISGKPISELNAKIWFGQISGAICYIHDNGIAHRDIKLENFLLNQDDDAILTDFGLATITHDRGSEPLIKSTICGTFPYMAPEIHSPPYDAKAVDIYAMGVCLFEMLNYDKPFDQRLPLEIYVKIQHQKGYNFRPNVQLTQDAKNLIDKLLEPIPGYRVTAQRLITHPWITRMDKRLGMIDIIDKMVQMSDGCQVDPKTAAALNWKGYRTKKKLSAGALGQVFTSQKMETDEKLYAVKVMDLDKCPKKFKNKFLPRELVVLITVKHENVIRIYDIFRESHKIYIFMEFETGTIVDYLKKHDAVTEPHACGRNFIKTRYVKEFLREYKELQQEMFEPDEKRRITYLSQKKR